MNNVNDLEKKLVQMSQGISSNSPKIVTINKTTMDHGFGSRTVVRITELKPSHSKVIPFNAGTSGDYNTVHGEIYEESFTRRKRKESPLFSLKGTIRNIMEAIMPEKNMYYDERGFEYFIGIDEYGNSFEYIPLTDGSIAKFISSNRDAIKISNDNNIYYFDGKNICWDVIIGYDLPRR